MQPVRRFEDVVRAVDVARAHRLQRVEVRRDRASRREVAAGRRDVRLARAAPAAARAAAPTRAARPTSVRSGACVVSSRRPHPQRGRADALHLGTDVEQQARHHLDVADARHVGEHALRRRSAGTPRAAAAPRSCCLRRQRVPCRRLPPSISSVDISPLELSEDTGIGGYRHRRKRR